MSTTYKVGQLLIAKSDIPVEMALSGETKIVRKGSKCIIGADNLAHHFNGCIQTLSKNAIVEGHDATGLAVWITYCLYNAIPWLTEALEDYDVNAEEVQSAIEGALEEIGFDGQECP